MKRYAGHGIKAVDLSNPRLSQKNRAIYFVATVILTLILFMQISSVELRFSFFIRSYFFLRPLLFRLKFVVLFSPLLTYRPSDLVFLLLTHHTVYFKIHFQHFIGFENRAYRSYIYSDEKSVSCRYNFEMLWRTVPHRSENETGHCKKRICAAFC